MTDNRNGLNRTEKVAFLLTLVLILPSVVWADTWAYKENSKDEAVPSNMPIGNINTENLRDDYVTFDGHVIPSRIASKTGNLQEFDDAQAINRFLENVNLEILDGDGWYRSVLLDKPISKYERSERIQLGIAHYLKALVLIEEERLRRRK